jgi:hypothetical protein
MIRVFAIFTLAAFVLTACKSPQNQSETARAPSEGTVARSEAPAPEGDGAAAVEQTTTEEAPAQETTDTPATEGLAGRYTNTHGIQVVGDGDEWEMEEATDCLSISGVDDERMKFAFELYFNNNHTCMMSGVAERDGPDQWVFTEKIEDGDCTLRISIVEDSIELRDSDSGCRAHYCGMRGLIDGASFSRDSHKSDPGSCGDVP